MRTRSLAEHIFACFFLLLAGNLHAAGWGAVRDASTGNPIANATVFVYWGHTVGPTFHGSYWWKCDGDSAAVTDAQGHFEISLPFGIGLLGSDDRRPRMLVVAPGYYDDRVAPRFGSYADLAPILRSLTWREHSSTEDLWTPTLVPFGDAGIDAKLLALGATALVDPWGAQVPDECTDTKGDLQYKAAVARAFDLTLCPNGDADVDVPRSDVFLVHRFGRHDLPRDEQGRYDLLYRELIAPLLGRSESRISGLALANQCAMVRAQRLGSDPTSTEVGGPLHLKVPVLDAATGAGIPNIPVRVLWGWRAPDPHVADYVARRGFVLRTDGDGRVELPISQGMLDEQILDWADNREWLRYAVVPMTSDRVNFDSGQRFYDLQLDGFSLHDHFRTHIVDLRRSPELERVDTAQAMALANDPGDLAGEVLGNQVWHHPAPVRALMDARAIEDLRNAKASGHPADFAIHMHPWRWPGMALLWRVHRLLASRVDVEADPQSWAQLTRDEIAAAFGQLCTEPNQPLTPSDTRQALDLLWWLEAVTGNRQLADVHAQQRATVWDHGIRCDYVDGQLISGGPSPDTFQSQTACTAWKFTRKATLAGGKEAAAPPPSLGELRLDFSHRAHSCHTAPDNGAFQ